MLFGLFIHLYYICWILDTLNTGGTLGTLFRIKNMKMYHKYTWIKHLIT